VRRDHTEGMNSRVHPTYKTKYCVMNWAPYDRALVGRGDVTLWVSPAAIATWEPAGVGTRGGQWKYSDVAIETALTLRLLFHLPLRQTEGFLHSLFGMMGIDLSAPDHTTLSRRGQYLNLTLDRVFVLPCIAIHRSAFLTAFNEAMLREGSPCRPARRSTKKLNDVSTIPVRNVANPSASS